MAKAPNFELAGVSVKPGTREKIYLPVAKLYTHTSLDVPVQVIHGRRPGPCLFVSAAIHGDEINGVEIIRRLHGHGSLKRLAGTLITVPVTNVFGFIHQSRYLPDRRDLNRAFPGRGKGSLASRLAHVFTQEIIAKCTHGIDLHTGSNHRTNYPQIRASLSDPKTRSLASVFGAPIVLNSNLRDGSLRQAMVDRGAPMLLYEAGEALRFDEMAIRVGFRGIIAVMRYLKMLPDLSKRHSSRVPWFSEGSTWVRATTSGTFVPQVQMGARVAKKDLLGHIYDPFGEVKAEVHTKVSGIPIGMLKLPLVYQGDAIYNIAYSPGELPDENHFDDFLPEDGDYL